MLTSMSPGGLPVDRFDSEDRPIARARRRRLVIDDVERLARAIAGGIDLDWWDLGDDAKALIRDEAEQVLRRMTAWPRREASRG